MFDLLNIYVEGDILATFVNLIGWVAALDCVSCFAAIFSNARKGVSK